MGRTFITGDTHRKIDVKKIGRFADLIGEDLSKEDVLIVAGDFGLYWEDHVSVPERGLLKWYESLPFTVLWIDGNHENHERIANLPREERFGGKVGVCGESVFHLRRGQIYTINDKTFWTFGGGYSIDKARRIPGVSWWAGELPTKTEMEAGAKSLQNVDFEVDYIITHTAPRVVTQELLQKVQTRYMAAKIDATPEHEFQDFLQGIMLISRFKRWFFGHFHEDMELRNGEFRCLYGDIEEVK